MVRSKRLIVSSCFSEAELEMLSSEEKKEKDKKKKKNED